MPRGLFYAVLVGPAQEFGRQWLGGHAKTAMSTAERVLTDADLDAARGLDGPRRRAGPRPSRTLSSSVWPGRSRRSSSFNTV